MRFLHTADWQLGMTRHFLNEEATRYVLYEEIRSTYDGPLSMATDMMVWNITKKGVTERMAVSPDEAWAVPGEAVQPPPRRKARARAA